MRTLAAALVLCTGCLISEPEGKQQSWPPSLGGTVESVVSGDLDANGSTDIVVFMSGTDAQAGMYYLKSDTDLVWDTGAPAKSFSRFVPSTITHPAATLLDTAQTPFIYLAMGAPLAIRQLSSTLETVDTFTTSMASTGTAPWLAMLEFPGGMRHVSASNGTSIDHIDSGNARAVPAPGGPSWNNAQLATTYTSGADQVVVVATADTVYRAVIPTVAGTMFSWQTVRTGVPWFGQKAYDINGDGRPEIIGLDPVKHDVCIVDPGAATIPVTTPACLHLPSTSTATNVSIFTGIDISRNPGTDILIAQTSATETAYTLVDNFTYTGTTLTALATIAIPMMGPANGVTVIIAPATGGPFSAITFATNGAVTCAVGPC